MMHSRRIEKQLTLLEEEKSLDIVSTAVYSMDDNGFLRGWRGATRPEVDAWHILKHGFLLHPTIAGRREWFLKNPYNEAYRKAQDLELWCRTASDLRFEVLGTPLHFYREAAARQISTYLASAYAAQQCIRVYGAERQLPLRSLYLLLRSYLKMSVHIVSHSIGLREWLIARRNSPLTHLQYQEACLELQKLRATPLPLCEDRVG
jgi:hypothetical protein